MSSVSKAGILIDLKQLLPFTYRMKNAMCNADRIEFGDKLVDYNLEMISEFLLAYHRKDEKLVFTTDDAEYTITNTGAKRSHIDRLEAIFNKYQTVMDFCFANLRFSKMKKWKRRKKHKHYMELMGKLSSGIEKWSRSVYKQVEVTKNITSQS